MQRLVNSTCGSHSRWGDRWGSNSLSCELDCPTNRTTERIGGGSGLRVLRDGDHHLPFSSSLSLSPESAVAAGSARVALLEPLQCARKERLLKEPLAEPQVSSRRE
jgi:hypothetical protein